jgi:HK97 gp10 family phage protein
VTRVDISLQGHVPAPDFNNAVLRALTKIGDRAARDAKSKVPVRRGRLRDAIRPEIVENGTAVSIKPKSAHYHLVEFGTKPHSIAPKRGKALVWGRGQYFSTGNQVAGVKARPYLRPAITQGRPTFESWLNNEIQSEWTKTKGA